MVPLGSPDHHSHHPAVVTEEVMQRTFLAIAIVFAIWFVTLGGCIVENQTALAADIPTKPPIEGAIWVQTLPEGGSFNANSETVYNGGKGVGGIMLWTENATVNNAPRTKTLPNGGGWRVGEKYAATNNDGIINIWLLPQGDGQ